MPTADSKVQVKKTVLKEELEFLPAGTVVNGKIPPMNYENFDSPLYKALNWYHRLGCPTRDEMKAKIAKKEVCDIKVADIDLLPWNESAKTSWSYEKEDVDMEAVEAERKKRDLETHGRVRSHRELYVEEAERKRQEEDEAKRQKEREERENAQRIERELAEEAERIRLEEEELKKEAEEAERRRKEEEERELERLRQEEEEAERLRKEEEERIQRVAEQRLREEKERKQREAEEAERLRREEEEREQERLRKEEEEAERLRQEEARKRREAEERRQEEERKRREEEEKKRQEEEERLRKKAEELERRKQETEELLRKEAEEAENRRKREEEEEAERERKKAIEEERNRQMEESLKKDSSIMEKIKDILGDDVNHLKKQQFLFDTRMYLTYQWWRRMQCPMKKDMLQRCRKGDMANADLYPEDVELLPWIEGFSVNMTQMIHWIHTLDPRIAEVVDRLML